MNYLGVFNAYFYLFKVFDVYVPYENKPDTDQFVLPCNLFTV